jgi:hypothetical protein
VVSCRPPTSGLGAIQLFNNGAADPQSHTRAVSLGGKERIEDLVRLPRWKSFPGIADRDQHLTILTALRLGGVRAFSCAMRDLLGPVAGYDYLFLFPLVAPTGNIGFFNFLHRLLKGKQLLLNPLYLVQYLGNRLRRIEAHI